MKKNNYYLYISILLFVLAKINPVFGYKFMGAKWPGLNPVVNYYLNERGSEDLYGEESYLHRSFDVWQEVPTTAIQTNFLGITDVGKPAADGKNVLMWSGKDSWNLDKNVIAVCYTWRQGGALKEFDIVFNEKHFQWGIKGEAGKMDVGHISTHEAGHALGLDHSEVSRAVMWPSARTGDVYHRELHADDSLGISALYPRTIKNNQAPIITSTPPKEAIAGLKYQYHVEATDPDGDPIRYSLAAHPLNMRIDSLSGKITWYPKFLDLGNHVVSVVATDSMGKMGVQSFQIAVSNLLVYADSPSVDFGEYVYQDIRVTPMDEYGAIAGNIELAFNNTKVTILDVDTTGTVLKDVSFIHNITTNNVKVAFASADPMMGEGRLFRLKLKVYNEHCGENIALPITKAVFNDGDPTAIVSSGTVFMRCSGGNGNGGYSLDGKILYQGNNRAVSGAKITFQYNNQVSVSGAEGFYSLPNIPAIKIPTALEAKKDSGDLREAITAYDASIILRNVVGLHSMKDFSNQINAADVNNNKMVTAYDAALILRFIVGENDLTKIGHWKMVPALLNIPKIISSIHDINFNAYLIGDVSGNWNISPELMRKPSVLDPSLQLFGVEMTLPEAKEFSLEEENKNGFQTEIHFSKMETPMYSGEFEMEYNAEKYNLADVIPDSKLNGYMVKYKAENGVVKIVFAGVEPVSEPGKLFDLRFVENKPGTQTAEGDIEPSMSYAKFNEHQPEIVGIKFQEQKARFDLSPEIQIRSFSGFSPRYLISFNLGSLSKKVSLTVYNIKGKIIKTWGAEEIKKGFNEIYWNPVEESEEKLAPQLLFLRLKAANNMVVKPLMYRSGS